MLQSIDDVFSNEVGAWCVSDDVSGVLLLSGQQGAVFLVEEGGLPVRVTDMRVAMRLWSSGGAAASLCAWRGRPMVALGTRPSPFGASRGGELFLLDPKTGKCLLDVAQF